MRAHRTSRMQEHPFVERDSISAALAQIPGSSGDHSVGFLLAQIDHRDTEIETLKAQLSEKQGELAVAYGGGKSEAETVWFSALDKAHAEIEALAVAMVRLRREEPVRFVEWMTRLRDGTTPYWEITARTWLWQGLRDYKSLVRTEIEDEAQP